MSVIRSPIEKRFDNSQILKLIACYHLRFKKQYDLVSTEVSNVYGSADVFAYSFKSGKTIEIETKISMADFYKDFDKIKWKIGVNSSWANFFYFLVPPPLIEPCKKYITDLNIPYVGLFRVVNDYELYPVIHSKENKESISDNDTVKGLGRRLSSENFFLRRALFQLKKPDILFQDPFGTDTNKLKEQK